MPGKPGNMSGAVNGISTRFSATHRPRRTQFLSQSVSIASVIAQRVQNPKVEDSDLANLVRSWVALMDCIREQRGIPKAGQLRPDLDPVQLARATKRQRARALSPFLELAQINASEEPTEAPTPTMPESTPDKSTDPTPTEPETEGTPETEEKTTGPKESLLPEARG